MEADESYYTRCKRGSWAYGKTIISGVFERNGKVYTEIVPNVKKWDLQAIIRDSINAESIINFDVWRC